MNYHCRAGCDEMRIEALTPRQSVENAQGEYSPLLGFPSRIEPEWLSHQAKYRGPAAAFWQSGLGQGDRRDAE